MNILDAQDKLKGLTDQQLSAEMQSPTGVTPQFLVLSEINRRKTMRDSMSSQGQSGATVAEEVVSSAGLPQALASQMARSMAPKSSIEQNTGISSLMQAKQQPMPSEPQRMAGGGIVRMAEGGGTSGIVSYEAPPTAFLMDPAVQAMASRRGVRPGQLWAQMSPEQRQAQIARLSAQTSRWPQIEGPTTEFMPVNPSYAEGEQPSFIMPPQTDLNRKRYEEMTGASASRPLAYTEDMFMPSLPSAEGGISAIAGSPRLPTIGMEPNDPVADALSKLYQTSDAQPQSPFYATGRSGAGVGAGEDVAIDLDLTGPSPDFETYGRNGAQPSLMDLAVANAGRGQPASGPAFEDYGRGIPTMDVGAGPDFEVYGRNAPASPMDAATAASAMAESAPDTYDERLSRIMGIMSDLKGERSDARMQSMLNDQFDENSGRALGMVAATRAASEEADRQRPPSQAELDAAAGRQSYTLPEIISGMVPDIFAEGGPRTNPREVTDADRARARDAMLAEQYGQYADRALPEEDQTEVQTESQPEAAVPAETAVDVVSGAAPVMSGDGGGAGGGNGGGGSSSGAGGAGGATLSYEQELINALGRAEKRAQQDKWLALAQVGMAMMASKSPTLAGAIGEAGIAGLEGYRKSRDDYENERLGLTKSIAELRAQRAASVGRGGGGAGAASGAPTMKGITQEVKFLNDQIKTEMELMGVGDGMQMTPEQTASLAPLLMRRQALIGMVTQGPAVDMTK